MDKVYKRVILYIVRMVADNIHEISNEYKLRIGRVRLRRSLYI